MTTIRNLLIAAALVVSSLSASANMPVTPFGVDTPALQAEPYYDYGGYEGDWYMDGNLPYVEYHGNDYTCGPVEKTADGGMSQSCYIDYVDDEVDGTDLF